jgi:hypothetical protein
MLSQAKRCRYHQGGAHRKLFALFVYAQLKLAVFKGVKKWQPS